MFTARTYDAKTFTKQRFADMFFTAIAVFLATLYVFDTDVILGNTLNPVEVAFLLSDGVVRVIPMSPVFTVSVISAGI